MDFDYLHTYFKQNKYCREIYYRFWKFMRQNEFVVEKLQYIIPIRDENIKPRINLVIPSMTKINIFGGINTAIDLFQKISNNIQEWDTRVVVLSGEKFKENRALKLDGFTYNQGSSKEVYYLANNKDELSIREGDTFICTSWKTAHAIEPILKWKKNTFNIEKAYMIYLIQDYEPGFYCWSAEYMLANNTYKQKEDEIWAIFNSKELFDYFMLNGYIFEKSFYFKPYLNKNLKDVLSKSRHIERKKQIIFYGRPGSKRNAYELIKEALLIWSQTYQRATEWEVIAIGDYTGKTKLANGKEVINLGKLTLEGYAQIMLESFAGISLMVSPHPSYPPLEMSTFGVKTITNTYANKDLSSFNSNIYSLSLCSIENIASELIEICEMYYEDEEGKLELESEYVSENQEFANMIDAICGEIVKRHKENEKC